MYRTDATPWSDSEVLFQAVLDENINLLKELLESGHSPNQMSNDDSLMTPLHYAADKGNLVITTLLLEYGANVNSVDSDGNIPLMNAVICEHEVSMFMCWSMGKVGVFILFKV